VDKHTERFDAEIKRLFGPEASYTGDGGTPSRPGFAEIRVNGEAIGRGENFEAALQDAMGAADLSAAEWLRSMCIDSAALSDIALEDDQAADCWGAAAVAADDDQAGAAAIGEV